MSVLQYSEDSNHFDSVNVYGHSDQIWALEASPKDPSLVVSSRQSNRGFKSVTLWKMPNQEPDDIISDSAVTYASDLLELQEKATFNQSQKSSFVHTIKWHRSQEQLLTLDNQILTAWNITPTHITVRSLPIIPYIFSFAHSLCSSLFCSNQMLLFLALRKVITTIRFVEVEVSHGILMHQRTVQQHMATRFNSSILEIWRSL